jgi:hypothetical protein
MEDYSKTLAEFEERFSTEDACRSYLYALRWPDGFVCPRCGQRKAWLMGSGLLLVQFVRLQSVGDGWNNF